MYGNVLCIEKKILSQNNFSYLVIMNTIICLTIISVIFKLFCKQENIIFVHSFHTSCIYIFYLYVAPKVYEQRTDENGKTKDSLLTTEP